MHIDQRGRLPVGYRMAMEADSMAMANGYGIDVKNCQKHERRGGWGVVNSSVYEGFTKVSSQASQQGAKRQEATQTGTKVKIRA